MSPPYDFDSLDGPLCVLVPRRVVAREQAFPVDLAFVDDGFTLALSGGRYAPENEIGAMLTRFDWAGRELIPTHFVDVDRAGNSNVGGLVFTGEEYVVTWGDTVGVPSGFWNVARVDMSLETRDVTRSLSGTPCRGAAPFEVGGALIQLLCDDGLLPTLSGVVLRPDTAVVTPSPPVELQVGGVERATGAWDGMGIGVLTAGDRLVFQRYALDATPLGAPLVLADARGSGSSIVWDGSSFAVAYAVRDAFPGVAGAVHYARISPDGEILATAVVAEGAHVGWHDPVIAHTGSGYAVAFQDGRVSGNGPARLYLASLDSAGTPMDHALLLAEVTDATTSPSIVFPVLLRTRIGLAVVYAERTVPSDHGDDIVFTLLGPVAACAGARSPRP